MAKYTNEFILRVREDAQTMTVKKLTEKYHMTTGKINYIIYKAKIKHIAPSNFKPEEMTITVTEPMKESLKDLLRPIEYVERPKPEPFSVVKFFKKLVGAG